MSLSGSGLLAIWNDIAPQAEAEFAAWHVGEHIPERVGLPGFIAGRRYVAVEAQPKYFNFYEAADAGVFESGAYLARLDDPTPWTKAVVAHFSNTSRTVCDVVASMGQGTGALVLTVRLPAGAAEAVSTEVLAAIAGMPGVVGVHLLRGHVDAVARATAETKLRSGPDERIAGLLLVECVEAASLRAPSSLLDEVLSGFDGVRSGRYRLQYVLTQAELAP